MVSQRSNKWLQQNFRALKQAVQGYPGYEPDHVDRFRHLCNQQLAGLLRSQHDQPAARLHGTAQQTAHEMYHTWISKRTQPASMLLVASMTKQAQITPVCPLHSHILHVNQCKRLYTKHSSLEARSYDHSGGLSNAQLIKLISQSRGKQCSHALKMLLPRMYSLNAQQVLTVVTGLVNASDKELQRRFFQSAMRHPVLASSAPLQQADVPLELLHNTAGAVVKLTAARTLQYDDGGLLNNIVKAVAGRTKAELLKPNTLMQDRQQLGSIESSSRMMYALAEAPRHLIRSETRRHCMRMVVHSLMGRMPQWHINVAPNLFNHMSRIQMQDEPAAILYVLAYAHATRHEMEPKKLAYLLYGFGLLARQNMRFCGALLRPDVIQLADIAAKDVATVLQNAPAQYSDSQMLGNDQQQSVKPWEWPPKSLPLVDNSLLSRPRSEIPEDQITKERLLSYVIPHGPGQPAHEQDITPWLPKLGQAGLPPLYSRQELHNASMHVTATPIQWILDIADTLSPHLHQLPERELALSVWSLYMSHLVSAPFLAAVQKVLLEKASHLNDQALSLSALGLAYLHVRGSTGPVVAALAHAYAVRHHKASLDITNEDLQAFLNFMHAMGIADQAGSLQWRSYVLARIQLMEKSGWDSLTHTQVRQVAGYLTVLRELEWEASRLRGDPDCPPVLWHQPPPKEGLVPWQEEWLRTLEPRLWERVGLEEIKETASTFHQSVRSTIARMIDQCGAAWNAPLYEIPREDKSGSMDILLTSRSHGVTVNIEADGPWHFAYNDPIMLRGDTARRVRAQARRGYLQLFIPWFEYQTRRHWPEKVRHMQQRMEGLLTKAFPEDPDLVQQLVGMPLDERRQWAAMVLYVAGQNVSPGEQLAVRSKAAKRLADIAQPLLNLRMMRTGEANSLAGVRTHIQLAKDMIELSKQLEAHCAALASKVHNLQDDRSATSPEQLLNDQTLLINHAQKAATEYVETISLGHDLKQLMNNVMKEIQQVRTSLARKASMRGEGHEGKSAHFAATITNDSHHEQKKPLSLLQLHNDLGGLYKQLLVVIRKELGSKAMHYNATWVLDHQDVLHTLLPVARELLAMRHTELEDATVGVESDMVATSDDGTSLISDSPSDESQLSGTSLLQANQQGDVIASQGRQQRIRTQLNKETKNDTAKKAGLAVDVDGDALIYDGVPTVPQSVGTNTQSHDGYGGSIKKRWRQQSAEYDRDAGNHTVKKARKSAGQSKLLSPPASMLM